jgi:hypothetical protein
VTSDASAHGDGLVRLLLRAGDDPQADGETAYALLQELFAGYPADRLAPLARSDRPAAAEAAAWLLSELGPRAKPELPVVADLLHHPSRKARYYAIDAVHAAADGADGDVVAAAIGLVIDADKAVRYRVLYLLTWATQEQLEAAASALDDADPAAAGTRWLARRPDSPAVLDRLSDVAPLWRRFAVAAAARLAAADPGPLERAATLPDADLRSFAADELASPRRVARR